MSFSYKTSTKERTFDLFVAKNLHFLAYKKFAAIMADVVKTEYRAIGVMIGTDFVTPFFLVGVSTNVEYSIKS